MGKIQQQHQPQYRLRQFKKKQIINNKTMPKTADNLNQRQYELERRSPDYINKTRRNMSPIIPLNRSPQQLYNPLLRMNRTQSQHSSQGNTLDMVRLVKRREDNRMSKMNNYRQLYGRYYDNNNNINNNRYYSRDGEKMMRKYHDQQDKKQQYEKQYKSKINKEQQLIKSPQHYQPPHQQLQNPLSPSIRSQQQHQSISQHNNPYHTHSHIQQSAHNRQSIFRPSQMHLLYQVDSSPRNRVIGWLLVVVFVLMYLQLVVVNGYFLNQSYFVYSDDERIRVWGDDINMKKEQMMRDIIDSNGDSKVGVNNASGYLQLQILLAKVIFTTALFLYSLSQFMYHLFIYIINNKLSQSTTDSTNRSNKNLKTTTISPLIDQQTSKLSYILHCRDFSRQSNTMIQKLIKSPKFTLFIIMVCVILQCYGTVKCFYYSQLNYLWVDSLLQYNGEISLYSVFQVMVFLLILPDVMGYMFFQRMHIVDNSNNQNNQKNNMKNQLSFNNQPYTSQFDQTNNIKQPLQQKNNNSFFMNPPPLTTFNTSKWHMKLSLIILILSIGYCLILAKYWLAIVMIAKIQVLFVKTKYRIDTFWVQFWGKLMIVIFGVVLLCYWWWVNDIDVQNILYPNLQQVPQIIITNSTYPTTLSTSLQIIMVTTISLLSSRLLASYYLREQLFRHLFQQMSLISYTIIGSIIIVYLLYKYIVDFVYIDYISLFILILVLMGLMVSLYQQGKQRQQIQFEQFDRQSQNIIQMQPFRV